MAWYAELKRKCWYCICGVDMIREYKQKLYDDWYNSLTDEQKERLKEIRRKKREKAEYEFNTAMMQLFSMYSVLSSRVPNKYRDIYDEYGFPK